MRLGYALLAVAIGGAIGSVVRYLVSTWTIARFGASFPWGTLAINLSGSFLFGLFVGIAESRTGISPYLRVFLTTGILGGYTTFSAFSFETYSLAAQGLVAPGLGYAFGSVVLGVTAAYAGLLLARIAVTATS